MRENGTEQNGMHALNDSDRDDRAGNRDEGNIPTVFLPLVLGPYSIAKYKWVGQLHCSLTVVVIIEMQSVKCGGDH